MISYLHSQNIEVDNEAPLPALPVHVTMLSSYIPPHQLASYQAYAKRFKRFSVLLSTAMERHRGWTADWEGVDVTVQRTWTFKTKWNHHAGFQDSLDIHVPIDTISQLRRLAPDVVISSELGFRSLVSSFYTSLFSNSPLILWACLSEHTERGRGFLRRILRGFLVRRAAAVIVNGGSGRRYIESLGVKPENIFEIPYCTPIGFFDRSPVERDEDASHHLLCVGQLISRKGVDPFLRTLVDWSKANPDRQVTFSIVGHGPLRAELETIAVPSNLRVDFLGTKSHQELVAVYASAGILVFPTLADEWGLVVNEAMASGLPILGSVYSGAVEELCDEGETGWIFRPDNQAEMARALDRAMNTPRDRLNEMRVNSKQRVATINSETCANRLSEVVRIVLARLHGRPNDD